MFFQETFYPGHIRLLGAVQDQKNLEKRMVQRLIVECSQAFPQKVLWLVGGNDYTDFLISGLVMRAARAAVAEIRPGCVWLAESVHRSFS